MLSLRLARALSLGLATAAVAALPWTLAARAPALVHVGPFRVGLQPGPVPALLLVLVTGIGAVVSAYAVRNLAGQRRLGRFAALEVATVLALATSVVAPSLPQLALGWTVAGLGIAALVAHAGTPQARTASRFVLSRLLVGDLALWAAVALVGARLGTLDLDRLAPAVAAGPSGTVAAAALLVVVAGVVRSGLVPSHRWLPETAEAPSPVSALLHAGVVNGAGVLALLLWPLVVASTPARGVLLLAGAATVLLGTGGLRVRVDVKGRLAGSTAVQMGYLAVQAALGLPGAVLAHLVGHGLWKASLFLGAGGAIDRARARGRAGRVTPSGRVATAATAGALVAAASTVPGPWGAPLVTGPAGLLPALVAAAALAVALSTTRRRGAGARVASSVVVVVAALGYVLGLRALTTVVERALPAATPTWSDAGWPLVLAVVVVLVGVAATGAVVDVRARRGDAPRLVSSVASTSTPPVPWRDRLLGRRTVRLDGPATPTDDAVGRARGLVGVAVGLVAPLWPLESFVASSPLVTLEHMSAADALRVAASTSGTPLGPSAAMLRAAVERGAVPTWALDGVCRARGLADGPDVLVAGRRLAPSEVVRALLLHDETDLRPVQRRSPMDSLATGAAARAAARATAYVDGLTARAYASTSWPAPAEGVLALLARDPHLDRSLNVRGASAFVSRLPDRPDAALAVLLERLGVAPVDVVGVLARALLRSPGWAAHLAWRLERDGRLPWVRTTDPEGRGVEAYADLLAARLAVEAVVVRAWSPSGSAPGAAPAADAVRRVRDAVAPTGRGAGGAVGSTVGGADDADALRGLVAEVDGIGLEMLRLEAWEKAYRTPVLDALARRAADRPDAAEAPGRPAVQLVTCIDVRSERLRRHVEDRDGWETFGTAGFFGLTVSHVSPTGTVVDLCPAVASPSLRSRETAGAQGALADATRAVGAVEHAPLVPVALAEAAGWVVGPWAALRTLAPGLAHRLHGVVARRWGAPAHGRLDLPVPLEGPGAADVEALADIAESFLRSTGLAELAPLVVLCGHGAAVANNPHVAAYDCGACGGHAGAVSARLMALVLQDPRVRERLAARGLAVPEGTRVVAALHDTTRDEVALLDPRTGDAATGVDPRYAEDLREACDHVRLERMALLPQGPSLAASPRAVRRQVARRAVDWAQPRPEWALAGNAALVIGPRSLTQGLDLDGRVFLQSYRHDLDEDGVLLESLLAGPLVVAQWISMQYWCSTVDPQRWGAGDKTTHNVVVSPGPAHPMSGVLTGARGDLRVGLPWQAVSSHAPDGARWRGATAHEPLRLLAVVAAPVERVDAVLARQPRVARLVMGGWVSLVVAEPTTGALLGLDPALGWLPVAARTPVQGDGARAGV